MYTPLLSGHLSVTIYTRAGTNLQITPFKVSFGNKTLMCA